MLGLAAAGQEFYKGCYVRSASSTTIITPQCAMTQRSESLACNWKVTGSIARSSGGRVKVFESDTEPLIVADEWVVASTITV